MKKFLLIPLLALAAIFMTVNEADAQVIKNGTTCTYAVDVFIAPFGSCTPVGGFFTVTATPGVATPVPLPPGFYVVGYRGYEVAPGPVCGAFKVGRACFGLPNTYSFSCTCTATANFFPATLGDMKIQ